MSTNTQAMNNINKVQAQATANKAVADKKSPDLQFEALFSSAMGQIAPNAQLNSIESQLRESLFKQDKPRKDTESNINAEAAQAAVWAQRNWMQQASAPAPQSQFLSVNNTGGTPQARANPEAARQQAANPQGTGAVAEKSEAPGGQASPGTSAKQPDPATENDPGGKSADARAPTNGTENSANANTPAQQASGTATVVASENTAGMPRNLDSSTFTLGNAGTATNPTQVQGSSPATGTSVLQAADTTAPRDTGNAQVDAMLNTASISKVVDTGTAVSPNGTPAGGNASAVAAQLAPQIAQQAQGTEAGLEMGELKPGQKILAAANLQATGNPNALAAGTNGLTGPSGTTQQTLIKTPVNQPGFAKELGQTVQWAIGKNMSTVDIRVNPESFGPLNMRLVQKGQQLQLVIRTQDEASANLLSQSLTSLKEVLAQNGLQLGNVQIQHNNTPSAGQGQNQQSQAQFEQSSGQQGRSGRQPAQGGHATDEQVPIATTAPGHKSAGQLDMFA